MKYRHIPSGIIAEFIKRINGNLLCVACHDRHHYLCYPIEQWVEVP